MKQQNADMRRFYTVILLLIILALFAFWQLIEAVNSGPPTAKPTPIAIIHLTVTPVVPPKEHCPQCGNTVWPPINTDKPKPVAVNKPVVTVRPPVIVAPMNISVVYHKPPVHKSGGYVVFFHKDIHKCYHHRSSKPHHKTHHHRKIH